MTDAIISNKQGNAPTLEELQATPFIIADRWDVEERRFATKQEAKQHIEDQAYGQRMYIAKIVTRTTPVKPPITHDEEQV